MAYLPVDFIHSFYLIFIIILCYKNLLKTPWLKDQHVVERREQTASDNRMLIITAMNTHFVDVELHSYAVFCPYFQKLLETLWASSSTDDPG